jgi:acyl transferase domain-containing protein/NADPH:quinone reductase-like Zn-dependent oxidoreductase/NAD(P)-dependent dehydrogenase (short-subunit alcohol dehydrogenase family)/acyl carrier protein
MSQPPEKVIPAPSESPALSPLKRAFLALEQAQTRVAALEAAAREPIAVIGIGCRTPGGAGDPESFWGLLRDGVDAISRVPADRMDIDALYDANPGATGKIATREGGFLGPVDGFDASFFGIAPREAQGMDPQQRLLLEVSWEALEHAGQAPDRLERSPTGVYMGVTGSDYCFLQLKSHDQELLDAHFASGMAHSIYSGRLSYLLGLQGPSLSVDTACSSSLVAVHLACQALRNSECRMALAGGVNLILAPDIFISLSHARMLAPDGRCKTFDAAADGFARGEGCGVVVLKKLSDARADGDRILAVIRGSALNQDGPSSGLTAPNGPAQEAVIREALARAGLAPRDVGYIEAHGTGTQLGDPLEVHALGAVFGSDRQQVPPLWIGSGKTNVGHLEAAAGVAGLIKLVLSLHHRTIPAHLHFQTPSPHIHWTDFPLRVSARTIPWEPINGRRIGGVSAFGFSGTNAHVVVEEYSEGVAADRPVAERPASVFTLSAGNEAALRELAGRYAAALQSRTDVTLADVCRTANTGRAQLKERAALVVRSLPELQAALTELAAGQKPRGLRCAHVEHRDPPRIAFLFTGQGAQYANMTKGLYEASAVYRSALDECARLLAPHLERPLLEVLFPSDNASTALDATAYTQPALFAVEYAMAQLWRSWGITPNIVMGHSVGEVVAACIAGVFDLADALRLVAQRGRLMQSLPSGGAMAAINSPEDEVARRIQPYARSVSIAAINGPAQTVISGAAPDVSAACDAFTAAGVRCKALTVSHAFHSPLVDPILERFEKEVAGIRMAAPRLRLVSNLTGRVVDSAEVVKPSYWRRHVREPVRFADGLRALNELRPDCLIEVGPQPTLLAFASALYGEDGPARIATLRKGAPEWDHVLDSLAALWLAGAQIDWRAVSEGSGGRIVDLPTYPFQRQRCWFETSRRTPQSAARGRNTGHPILGTRLRSAVADIVYESDVGADVPSFVRQHRVLGRVVLPATAYLDALMACGRDVLGAEDVVVEDIAVREAMLLADDGTPATVQTVVSKPRNRKVTVSISSLAESAAESDAWAVHVTANARIADAPAPSGTTLETARECCSEEVVTRDFYAAFGRRGMDFGPGFHSIRQLWRGELQALGRIELAADLLPEAGAFRMHPVLLDGCLQVGAAALPVEDDQTLFLPIGIGAYRLLGSPTGTCWAHVLVHPHGGEVRRLDLRVFDERGALLAQLQDLQVKRVTREALQRLGERWLDDSLYQAHWRNMAIEVRAEAVHSLRTWLLFADQGGTIESLALKLRATGDRCVLVRPGRFGLDGDRASLDPTVPGDYGRLLESVGQKALTGVIHAWSLDTAAADAIDLAGLSKAQDDGVLSTLALAQALVAGTPAPRLWLVTRGGQPVDALERGLAPAEATVWGFGRALALGHPELRCVNVDLDSTPTATDVERLLAELAESGFESQVAYRSGERRVARLVRMSRSGASHAAVPDSAGESWRLVPAQKGSLDGFTRVASPRRTPQADEVEIAVEASALNFRDVLNALGMYPGDPGPLGGECSGRVVAVGSRVTHVRPGDSVVAVAGGSFASHVLARAELVQPRPPGVSAEEGASFSIPYITAEFCLGYRAQMRKGDRVLIHAAAGGVGMAAVRLAQRAGAEIFATAGSEAKRHLLRTMGVQHVFDSRSTAFAAPIMAATGGHGVDVVLNSLAGEILEATFAVLATGGRFVEIGKRGIKDAAWVESQQRGWRYFIVDWSETAVSDPELIRGLYARLVAEWREGTLPPLPRHVFALEETARAFRYMAQARHVGKIVIRHGQPAPFAARREGTYLVTGGLSGLGLRVARWLAERGAGRLVLLGRRGLTPESAGAVEEIRAAGAEVVIEAADVSDERALGDVFARIRANGPPLRGIVHSAGVIDDAALLRQDAQRFGRVFAPKVQGAWLLDRLARTEALDWFVMFSSVASVLGSAGQTNYSAANAFLDVLAHERHHEGLPALSINWGAWTDIGAAVDRGLMERLAAQGLGTLAPSEGLSALARLVGAGIPQAAVFPVDWNRFVERLTGAVTPAFLSEVLGAAAPESRAAAAADSAARADDLRQQLLEAPESRRHALVTTFVRDHAARALGLAASNTIDPRTPLGELGLDSLLAVELRNTLGSALGTALPATLLFDYPSVESLTEYLLHGVLGFSNQASAPPPAAPKPSPGQLVGDIEAMSDDEVERQIAARAKRKA